MMRVALRNYSARKESQLREVHQKIRIGLHCVRIRSPGCNSSPGMPPNLNSDPSCGQDEGR